MTDWLLLFATLMTGWPIRSFLNLLILCDFLVCFVYFFVLVLADVMNHLYP